MRSPSELAIEADYLCSFLFGRRATSNMKVRYVNAHTVLSELNRQDSGGLMRTIVDQGLDLEAVEFALRRKEPVIGWKVHLLVYLAECEPDNLHSFVNTRRTPPTAVLTCLVGEGFRSIWKYFKGWLLVRRHKLV